MLPGSIILVDDGTCGKGKIKQVTGGELGAINPRPAHPEMHSKRQLAEARCGFALKLIGTLWRVQKDALEGTPVALGIRRPACRTGIFDVPAV